MPLEEHQPESAATGNERVGTDDTTLMTRVEPRSLGESARPGGTRTPSPSSNVPVEEPEQMESEAQLPRKKRKPEKLEFEA